MANPNRPPGTNASGGILEVPPGPSFDPEQFRQIQLLAEARLVSFTATPPVLAPYGRATLAWDIAMPTTFLPGVHVEAHIQDQEADNQIQASGTLQVQPYSATTFSIYVRTPLAVRQLGTLALAVDFASCTGVDIFPAVISAIVKGEANKAFPAGGEVSLRGDGASIDIGINAFVVDIPLEVEVPNWFNADIDVSMGFSMFSEEGRARVKHDFATTRVSFGVASSILSSGVSAVVATALEKQSDAFLNGFIGDVLAERMQAQLADIVAQNLARLNSSPVPPVPYRFYGLRLTEVGMTLHYCPTRPPPPPSDTPPRNGDPGNEPLHT